MQITHCCNQQFCGDVDKSLGFAFWYSPRRCASQHGLRSWKCTETTTDPNCWSFRQEHKKSLLAFFDWTFRPESLNVSPFLIACGFCRLCRFWTGVRESVFSGRCISGPRYERRLEWNKQMCCFIHRQQSDVLRDTQTCGTNKRLLQTTLIISDSETQGNWSAIVTNTMRHKCHYGREDGFKLTGIWSLMCRYRFLLEISTDVIMYSRVLWFLDLTWVDRETERKREKERKRKRERERDRERDLLSCMYMYLHYKGKE